MTLRDVLRMMARRWYIVVAVFAAAAVIGVLFARDGGTYSTRTIVTFTLPAANTLSPENGADNESIIAFAGTVATQINLGKPPPRYSRGDAPYYGAGVREGVLVGLRDEGSQWGPSFRSAIIEIQIVGRTYEWVEDQQRTILAEIVATAAAEQSADSIAEDQRIAVHVEPLTTRIEHITASRTAQLAAALALLGAALLVGGWAAAGADRIARHRRTRTHSGIELPSWGGATA